LAKRLAKRQASGGLSEDEMLSEIAWSYWMFFLMDFFATE
tara:strand:+ start:237 stop:356 length:120 start_codon:yes stop_codon:yes gene_type:complete